MDDELMGKERATRERTAFGQRMLAARKHAGLTQMAVRKALEVSQGTISELEGAAASSGSVVEYAQLYGVSAVWLATGAGSMAEASPALSVRAALIAQQIDEIGDPELRGRTMVLMQNIVELAQAGSLDAALRVLQAAVTSPPPAPPTDQPHQPPEPQSGGVRAKRT